MAYLLVDAADVFAKQADTEQGQADEKEGNAEQGEHAFCLRSDHQSPNEQEDDEQGGEEGNADAQHREELQRHQRETGHQVEIEADQAVQRILGIPGVALFVGNFDLDRILREGVGQGRDEGTDFAAIVDGVDNGARIRAQHAALVGHLDVGDAFAQAVHGLRRPAPERCVLAVLADAADAVVTFAHLGDQLADFFRRVLQVGIQCHHNLSARMFKAGHDCHMLPGVGGEQDGPGDFRSLFELRAQQGGGAVTAAVVDEDHFVGCGQGIEGRIEPVEEGRQAGFFVVDRDNNGNFRSVHFWF